MTLKAFAFSCGAMTARLGRMMAGGEGEVTIPIPAFLIEHPKGRVLFDTGLHPDCQHDPAGRIGSDMARAYAIDFKPGQEISGHLTAMGRDPAKIDLIIASHLHFDHVGGNALVPNATLILQRREWEAAARPEAVAAHGYDRRDFDLGHRRRLIEGEHDVFGDGSVVCLPTHGHTPGHQSLRLRGPGGDWVLTADACYFCETLAARRLPRHVDDREAMLASLDRLAAMERAGARLIFGHDPGFWTDIPQAPRSFL